MANLCVLQLYDERSDACNYIEKVLKDDAVKDAVPKIYYTQTPQQVLKGDPVDLDVAFKLPPDDTTRVSSLTYYLARYTLEGHFEGY